MWRRSGRSLVHACTVDVENQQHTYRRAMGSGSVVTQRERSAAATTSSRCRLTDAVQTGPLPWQSPKGYVRRTPGPGETRRIQRTVLGRDTTTRTCSAPCVRVLSDSSVETPRILTPCSAVSAPGYTRPPADCWCITPENLKWMACWLPLAGSVKWAQCKCHATGMFDQPIVVLGCIREHPNEWMQEATRFVR